MSQEVVELTNEITEGIMDYVTPAVDKAMDMGKKYGSYVTGKAKDLYRNLPISDAQRSILFPEIEHFKDDPAGRNTLAFQSLLNLGSDAIERGAGLGALSGAGGGAALGAALASGGVPRAVDRFITGFRQGRGGVASRIGSGAFRAGRSLVGSGVRAVGGGVGGGIAGGIAGARGGRETGAKIAGAAALGVPAALAGPFAGLGGSLLGAAGAGDIAAAVTKAQKKLAAGGGDGTIFA